MYTKNSSNTSVEQDSRTLPEIWKGLNKQEQEDIREGIIASKAAKTRNAIYYWCTGQRKPQSDLVRDRVALVVSRVIGKKCYGKTLFPLV